MPASRSAPREAANTNRKIAVAYGLPVIHNRRLVWADDGQTTCQHVLRGIHANAPSHGADPQSSQRTVTVIKAFLTKGMCIAMLVASERRQRRVHDCAGDG
jgi:hypothetical protein